MRHPQIVPLPPILVELLQVQAEGRFGPLQAARWQELKSELELLLRNARRWSSHQGLEESLSDAEGSFDLLSRSVGRADALDSATEAAFSLYRSLARYANLKKSLRVSRIEEINVMVHAVHAHLRGGAGRAEMEAWKKPLIAKIDQLLADFRRGSDHLPVDVQQALLQGFQQMNKAMAELSREGKENLERGADLMTEAAVLLDHLAGWKEQVENEFVVPVPEVGRELGELLEELRRHGEVADTTLDYWYEELLGRLEEAWSSARQDLFMPRRHKDRFVAQIDEKLLALQALERMSGDEQLRHLNRLCDLFHQASENSFKPSEFDDHPQPWIFDLLAAVLAGGVPRFQIERQIEAFRGTVHEVIGGYLQAHLADGDRDHLLDAVERLRSEIPPRPLPRFQR